MKSYECKICRQRNEKYSGTRQMVRKHLREEHLIKGKRTNLKGSNFLYAPSKLTLNTLSGELK